MITKSELEAKAITGFQDSVWEFAMDCSSRRKGTRRMGIDCRQVLLNPPGRSATAESGNPCSLLVPVNDP